jgi:hypothetical protein
MRTTKKDFEAFKAEFIRWQDLLGLKDWRVRFHHERLENGVAACVCPDCESRLVGVFYGFICDHAPEEAARHEALELLMSDMEEVARARYIRPDDVVEARHAVIRRLENLIDHFAGARKPIAGGGGKA